VSASILTTHDLSIGYRINRRHTETVLSRLNVELRPGEFVCLLGPNGAGKSTLLRTLGGVQAPLGGSAHINDINVHTISKLELARLLSVVLTDRLEVGNLTAYDLVSLGRHPHTGLLGRLSPIDHRVVRWAMHVTRSTPLADRYLSKMSDGQRQRILIARALAQEPQVMFLDEPTAFLDLPTRVEITGLLRRLARDVGLAVLLSTHDLDLALRLADTLWLVTRDGRLVTGTPEDIILRGDLQASFASDEIAFDVEAGGFRLRTADGVNALIHGESIGSTLARRALEREGYHILDRANGKTPQLEIECWTESERPLWRIRGTDETHTQIGDLIAQVRASNGNRPS
jgi:iron complex transport system ATP-binding protein